ncbi:MAG: phosphatase PAP2 family protein [Burkholderiales bacterium]
MLGAAQAIRWSARTREQVAVLIALALALGVFALWPQIDLRVSAWAWRPGEGFVWRDAAWVQALYTGVPRVGRGLALGLLVVALLGRSIRVGRRWRQRAGLALVAAVIGQGLMIDQGLKNHWGRPRPADVTAFGGTLAYQPPLAPSALCERNCSFVSGHAAAGFGLLALGLLAPPAARRRWLVIGLVCGSVFGLARVLQGGHFLSDIVFSFFATWLGAQMALRGWRGWVRYRRRRRTRRVPRRPRRHNEL